MSERHLHELWRGRLALGGTLLAGILVALFLLLKLSPVATPAKWDECLYVYDAQRVSSGQVPYRDFFNFTPPGIFYTLAAWSAPWAPDRPLTAGRYYAMATALLGWWLGYRALKRASWGRAPALATSALLPVSLFPFWPIPSHHWLGLLPWLAAFEAYDFKGGRVRGAWGWVWIGAMGGLSLLALQTNFLDLAVYWGAFWLLGETRKPATLAWCGLGFLATCGPVLAALAIAGAARAMVRDVVLWTGGSYAAEGGPNAVRFMEDLPDRVGALWHAPPGAGGVAWLVWASAGTLAYLGLAALALLFVGWMMKELWRGLARRKLEVGLAVPAVLLTAVDLALFLKGKTDWLHLTYAMAPVGMAWALASPVPAAGTRRNKVLAWGVGILLGASVLFHLAYLANHRPALWEFTDVDRPTREAPVNRWLRAQPWLAPADTIAAFPEGGQVYLYTRPAAVGYTLFLPLGDHLHTLADHLTVAEALRRRGPRCVVLTTEREADYLDSKSPVAEVLAADYQREAVVGDAVVYRKRPAP